MAIRIIGRSQLPGRSGRIRPQIRFRQTQFKDRVTAQKAAKKKTSFTKTLSFGPLTGVGALLFIGGVFLFLGSLWFFVFSSTFLVKAVEIEGNTSLSREQIAYAFYNVQNQRVLFIIPGNHIVFLSKNRMRQALNSLYPYVGSVENYKRRLPASVSFAVTEKEPEFYWQDSDGRKFLLDDQGVILAEARDSTGDLVVLEGSLGEQAKLGGTVSKSEVAKFALEVNNSWPNDWSFKPVKYQIVQVPGGGEFLINTNEGWVIKAVSDIEPKVFLKNLEVIFKTEIKEQSVRANLSYIDLRLSNRAFYCLKEQPCSNK